MAPIVSAVGIATGAQDPDKTIQEAMRKALEEAQARGIANAEELKRIMLEARNRARDKRDAT